METYIKIWKYFENKKLIEKLLNNKNFDDIQFVKDENIIKIYQRYSHPFIEELKDSYLVGICGILIDGNIFVKLHLNRNNFVTLKVLFENLSQEQLRYLNIIEDLKMEYTKDDPIVNIKFKTYENFVKFFEDFFWSSIEIDDKVRENIFNSWGL